jgi:hypothetical protein
MEQKGHETHAFANADFMPNERLHLFAEFTYTQADQGLGGFTWDMSQVAGIPPGGLFDYALLYSLGDYSHLRTRQIRGKYGFSYDVTENWFVKSYFFHNDYQDTAPYLQDTTGSYLGAVAGFGYKF